MIVWSLIFIIVGLSLLILLQDEIEDEDIDILDLFEDAVEDYLKDRLELFEYNDVVIFAGFPVVEILSDLIYNDSDLFTKDKSDEIAFEIFEKASDEIDPIIWSAISDVREELKYGMD